MKKILAIGLLAGSAFIAGCGTKPEATETAATGRATTTATEPTTTTTVAPTTTTANPMILWAAAHSDDLSKVNAAIQRVGDLAGQISDQAGNNIDDFTATNDPDVMIRGTSKITALIGQQKQACLAMATTIKTAQKHLPMPLPSVNEPYETALDHFLSASRACQVENVKDTAAEIVAGNSYIETANDALEVFVK